MLRFRSAPAEAVVERRRVDLTVRAGSGDTVLVRASNDQIADHYGTVITAEALLRDWWQGYAQHRTVSLQHNLPELRGVKGQANVGRATRVDFTPQLEVAIKILDPQVMDLVRSGKIGSASLEFVPLETERRAYGDRDQAEVYHRLSPEPEHTGLSLVDVPGVPGADLLSLRSLPALWAYAVVDPKVLNGDITDPDQVRQLAWLPHHDERSHSVDETQLRRALEDLEQGRISIPPFASLTAAQVADRARAHLERHTHLGLGRTHGARAHKEGQSMNKWIQARAAQLVAEGVTQADADKQAKAAYQALTPEVRARVEGEPVEGALQEADERPGLFSRLFGRSNVTVNVTEVAAPAAPVPATQPVQARAAAPAEGQPTQSAQSAAAQSEQRSARDAWLQARAALLQVESGLSEADARATAQEQLDADFGLQARLASAPALAPDPATQPELPPEIRALLRQPENPMAAIASGLRIRGQRMDGEQLLAEVLMRTVVPQMAGQRPTTRQLTEAYNMLAEAGINARALTIEANGTVIYEDMARQFVVRPEPDVVFRNHMASIPMGGTKKRTFPRFDRAGIAHQWNRASTADIAATDPTTTTFDIEVAELNSKVNVADSFSLFNAQGASFVSQHLLPAIRGAAQYEEDRVFFLGTGAATDPVEFKGLKHVTGVTSVVPATDGDTFSLDILSSLLRALPVRYRNQVGRLAYYAPVSIADDFADIIADRATALGDAFLSASGGGGMGLGNAVGPTPVGYYRRIPVYGIAQLPDDETQGTSHDAGTVYLVHRDIPVIGDALSIRIEPFRAENFITKLQLQQWVGLGYQWPEAIVRRAGVRPKATV